MKQPLQLAALPALQDNYIWAFHNGQHAVVVDPGEALPVQRYLQEQQLQLTAILITHHHWDHSNGIAQLQATHPAPVIGPAHEQQPIHGLQVAMEDGQSHSIDALGLSFTAMHVPGHTLGATAFYCADFDADGLVFTGDTLFMAGCGRLFEGTAAQMHASLQRLAALPASTRVCCGHEYSLANLQFALAVEPDNAAVTEQIHRVTGLRNHQQPSLPSTIAMEQAINPFIRVAQPGVVHASSQQCGRTLSDPAEVFAALRLWKDNYRGA